MKILDPGHDYELDCLDAPRLLRVRLRFVKRIGDKYPDNEPPGHSGTTTQEVIRALIDRTIYVDHQRHNRRNPMVIDSLREALRQLELRAAEERDESRDALRAIATCDEPEDMPTCDCCGHVECHTDHVAAMERGR